MKMGEPTESIWWISTKDYFTTSNQTKQAHPPPLTKATEE